MYLSRPLHLGTIEQAIKHLPIFLYLSTFDSSIYVPNLAGQSHRAAIPEARRPQRLPHTDLYAAASAFGVPHFPLVLGAHVS